MSWSFTRSRRIDYNWHCAAIPNEIPKGLRDLLIEHAEEVITHLGQEGYSSGQLVANIDVDLEGMTTPEGGWHCEGWWTIKGMD